MGKIMDEPWNEREPSPKARSVITPSGENDHRGPVDQEGNKYDMDRNGVRTIVLDLDTLKSKIISAWSTVADLDAALFALTDDPSGKLTEDELANILTGLKELHNSRCKELMYVFNRVMDGISRPPKPQIEDRRAYDQNIYHNKVLRD